MADLPVVLVVLLVGAFAAALLVLTARSGAMDQPMDPEAAESWLVRRFAGVPWVGRLVHRADHRVLGGAGVALAFVVVFVAAGVVGWIFDGLDAGGGFARWDDAAAQWGSDNATATSTDVLGAVTRAGDTVWLLVLMAAIGAYDYATRRNLQVFAFLAATGLGVSLLNNGLKWIVGRQRPQVNQLVDWGGSSFPSGHSAAAAACWAAIALVLFRHVGPKLRPLIAALAFGIACAVAASRVLLGVHWLTDVIAGVVVGWAWFSLVALAFGGRLQRLGEPADRAEHHRDLATAGGPYRSRTPVAAE